MEKVESDNIPPEGLVRACLEEKMSALRQNLPIPEEIRRFDSFHGRMLSGLLDMLDERLADEDFDNHLQEADLTPKEREVLQLHFEHPQLTGKQIGERLGRAEGSVRATFFLAQRKLERIERPLDKAVGEAIAYDAKAANVLSHVSLEMLRLYEEDPSQFSAPIDFKGKVKDAYEVEKELKSRKKDFNAIFDGIIQEPVIGLSKQLNFVIWEHRLHRRYLRSRFGMKERPLRRLIFKQTRSAKWKRNNFQNWWRRNGYDGRGHTTEEVKAAYRRWRHELSREKGLFRFAQERLISANALKTIWKNIIFISFATLHKKYNGTEFDVKEFAFDILQRVKPALKDFTLIMKFSELELKQEFSLDYEDELAALTAWAARNINLGLNRGAAQALKAEGKPVQEAKLEKIPANILLALAETDRQKPLDCRNILSRVAEMLRNELPLDAKHETLRQNRLRKGAKKEEKAESGLERHAESSIVKPEDLAERHVEDFILREEARIDFENLVKRAKLTPLQRKVLDLDLQDLTDKEIAQYLDKPVGTVKPLLFKARKKLKEARDQM